MENEAEIKAARLQNTDYFVEGPIPPEKLLAAQISTPAHCGALAQFLGVVRADEKNGLKVTEIVYSAYKEMALQQFDSIINEIMKTHHVAEVQIVHSVGQVRVGEAGMLVSIHAAHRREAFAALSDTVDLIKAHVPIWKKEIFEDGSYEWALCATCSAGHKNHDHKVKH